LGLFLEVNMDLSKMTRRDFHKSTTLGVTSLALSAGPAVRNVIGANDRIGIGLIGAGGQGRFDFSSMIRTDRVNPVAVADVYTLPLAQTLDATGTPPGKTVGSGSWTARTLTPSSWPHRNTGTAFP
jgi:hypothetical protein